MDQPAGGEGTPGKTWEDDGETNENPLEKITDDSNYRGLLDDLQEHLETLERLTGALPGSSGRGNDVAQ
jgi:hypothetical protein